jgi:hypothetical protein
MELPEYLNTPFPYIALALAFSMALVFLFLKKRVSSKSGARNCPHCQQMIDINEHVCNFCHRIIS